MELSKGFNNLEKKTNRTHTNKVTLLPSKLILNYLQDAKARVLPATEKNTP
jgi:hypothetical protein